MIWSHRNDVEYGDDEGENGDEVDARRESAQTLEERFNNDLLTRGQYSYVFEGYLKLYEPDIGYGEDHCQVLHIGIALVRKAY